MSDPDAGALFAGQQWRHPSPDLGRLRRLEVVGATLAIGLIGAGAVSLSTNFESGGLTLLGVLLAGLLLDRLVQRRVRAWAYCEREDDLVVSRGLLFTRLSVVPYGRMQFVDVVAGPLERSFGLATVHLHTASAASDARIPGLDQAEAARLRDQLSKLGEARAAGL